MAAGAPEPPDRDAFGPQLKALGQPPGPPGPRANAENQGSEDADSKQPNAENSSQDPSSKKTDGTSPAGSALALSLACLMHGKTSVPDIEGFGGLSLPGIPFGTTPAKSIQPNGVLGTAAATVSIPAVTQEPINPGTPQAAMPSEPRIAESGDATQKSMPSEAPGTREAVSPTSIAVPDAAALVTLADANLQDKSRIAQKGSLIADPAKRNPNVHAFDAKVIAELNPFAVESQIPAPPEHSRTDVPSARPQNVEAASDATAKIAPQVAIANGITGNAEMDRSARKSDAADSHAAEPDPATEDVPQQAVSEPAQGQSGAALPKSAKQISTVDAHPMAQDGKPLVPTEPDRSTAEQKTIAELKAPTKDERTNAAEPVEIRPHGAVVPHQATYVPTDSTADTPSTLGVNENVKRIADHIEQMAASAKSGTVTIHLRPSELGTVSLTVRTMGLKVDAEVAATHDGLAAALMEHRSDLSKAIEAQGLSLGQVLVGHHGQGHSQSQGQSTLNRSDFERISNLRGAVADRPALSTAPPRPSIWSGRGMDFIA